jgi:hypothetical protein
MTAAPGRLGLFGAIVLSGVVSPASWAEEPSVRVALEDQAKPSFAALCGTIGVTVEQYGRPPRSWPYQIMQGEVAPAATLPAASKAARGYDPFGARQLTGSSGSARHS